MDLISCTLGLAHRFQQNSVGSLGHQWLWHEMGLLRLLLSSTVIVSLHLWKVCTKQQANKVARWSCSCLGYKTYTNSPWACLPGSFIFITIHEQGNGSTLPKHSPFSPGGPLHHKQQSVSSVFPPGVCGLSNAYILSQQAPCSALLWAEYCISDRRPAAEPIEQNAAKPTLDKMQ